MHGVGYVAFVHEVVYVHSGVPSIGVLLVQYYGVIHKSCFQNTFLKIKKNKKKLKIKIKEK